MCTLIVKRMNTFLSYYGGPTYSEFSNVKIRISSTFRCITVPFVDLTVLKEKLDKEGTK